MKNGYSLLQSDLAPKNELLVQHGHKQRALILLYLDNYPLITYHTGTMQSKMGCLQTIAVL